MQVVDVLSYVVFVCSCGSLLLSWLIMGCGSKDQRLGGTPKTTPSFGPETGKCTARNGKGAKVLGKCPEQEGEYYCSPCR